MGHKVGFYEDLYPQVYDWDNLLLAYRRASKGKRGNPAVAAFEYRLEDNLIRLQEELVARTYQPGPDYSFYIHEPKRRLISAAPFKDRVDHHALCNVIELLFERSFISDSYANRVGKGTHRALDRAQQFARRRTSSATPLDIRWSSETCFAPVLCWRRTSSATPLDIRWSSETRFAPVLC